VEGGAGNALALPGCKIRVLHGQGRQHGLFAAPFGRVSGPEFAEEDRHGLSVEGDLMQGEYQQAFGPAYANASRPDRQLFREVDRPHPLSADKPLDSARQFRLGNRLEIRR
jgi:hypothetical protein